MRSEFSIILVGALLGAVFTELVGDWIGAGYDGKLALGGLATVIVLLLLMARDSRGSAARSQAP